MKRGASNEWLEPVDDAAYNGLNRWAMQPTMP